MHIHISTWFFVDIDINQLDNINLLQSTQLQ